MQVERDGGAKGQRFERLGQPAFGQHRGVEPAGELADLLEAGGEFVDGDVDQRRALLGRVAKAAETEQDAR